MRRSLFCGLGVLLFSFSALAIDFNPDCYQYGRSEILASFFQRWSNAKNSDAFLSQTKYTASAGGVGYQYATPTWTAGGTFSYEYGTGKNYANGFYFTDPYSAYFKTRDETFGFTLFGEYRAPVGGWYGKGSTFLGFADVKMRDGNLSYLGDTVYGYGNNTDHQTRFGASLELGKVFDFGNAFKFTPHAGFDYAYAPGSELTGALDSGWPVGYGAPSQNYFEFPIGVRFEKDFVVGYDWVLKPSLDLTFVPTAGHMDAANMNYRTGFASYTGGSQWKVYGIGADHWGGRVTAGIDAVKSDRFDLGVNYTYEGRDNYNDHRLVANFGVAF